MLFRSMGKSLGSRWFKSYIHVDEKAIRVKTSVFSKERIYDWNIITSIHFGESRIAINDDPFFPDKNEIKLSEYAELRDIISEIAGKNGIEI